MTSTVPTRDTRTHHRDPRRPRFPEGPALARRTPLVLRSARQTRRRDELSTAPPRRSSRCRNRPSGLGWLPDGRHARRVDARPHASCGSNPTARSSCTPTSPTSRPARATTWSSTRTGRAYVGNFGFDMYAGAKPARDLRLIAVEPDGTHAGRRRGARLPERLGHHARRRHAARRREHGEPDHRVRHRRRRHAQRIAGCGRRSRVRPSTECASMPKVRSGPRARSPDASCGFVKAARSSTR